MRGDQLARQWRLIRAIEASPNGLTVAEIVKREETGYEPSTATWKPSSLNVTQRRKERQEKP